MRLHFVVIGIKNNDFLRHHKFCCVHIYPGSLIPQSFLSLRALLPKLGRDEQLVGALLAQILWILIVTAHLTGIFMQNC